MKNYDVILVPSTTFFEKLWFGRYKSAGLVIPITPPGEGIATRAVMVKDKIVMEVVEFKRKHPECEVLTIPFNRSKQEVHKAFLTVLGNNSGHNSFQTIARIFGLKDWDEATGYTLKNAAE